MTSADTALWGFTLFNTVRVLAYVPQMIKIRRDPHGAVAVSLTTWIMFALSHCSTVAYAILAARDFALAIIFGVNAAFCLSIVALAMDQRRRCRRVLGEDARSGWPSDALRRSG